jgi:periplasmic divalent cation tolerance protein
VTGIVTVYATFPDAEEAARVARCLVEAKLAACANIIGEIRSIYRWQGQVEDARETAILFKTSAETADRLIARLAELHSHVVPAAVVWPIASALPAYAEWVVAETQR